MRPIPPATSALTQHWFAACREGRLLLQRCRCCERLQFYPRTICAHCHSAAPEWVEAAGLGSIASFTVVRRAISPDGVAPYVIALVDLAEGPRMMTRIVACQPEELRIGRAVRLRFESWADDTPMPVFTLQDDPPGNSPEHTSAVAGPAARESDPPGDPPKHTPGDRSQAGAVSAADRPAAEPTARR